MSNMDAGKNTLCAESLEKAPGGVDGGEGAAPKSWLQEASRSFGRESFTKRFGFDKLVLIKNQH